MTLSIPFTITNGIAADGDNLGANFTAIEAWAATADARSTALEVGDVISTAKFQRTTDIVLADSTSSDVTIEVETNDVDGWWSSGTTFTAPASGVYLFTLINKWASGAGWGRVTLTWLSGTVLSMQATATSTTQTSSASLTAYAEAGSTFKLAASEVGVGADAVTLDTVTLIITRIAVI